MLLAKDLLLIRALRCSTDQLGLLTASRERVATAVHETVARWSVRDPIGLQRRKESRRDFI